MGSECRKISQVIKTQDKVVFNFIQNAIDHYNKTQAFINVLKVMTA